MTDLQKLLHQFKGITASIDLECTFQNKVQLTLALQVCGTVMSLCAEYIIVTALGVFVVVVF